MTSVDLLNKLKPSFTTVYHAYKTNDGLTLNVSDLFTILIKDAARCNHYASDVYYDLHYIEKRLHDYDGEFEPIWVGFRKLGVDGTNFVLCKVNNKNVYGSLSDIYFALYSIEVSEDDGDYKVVLNSYGV